MLLYTIGVLILVSFLAHQYCNKTRNAHRPPAVCGAVPLLGNIYEIIASAFQNKDFLTSSLHSWAMKYGALFRINLQGDEVLVVSDVDLGYDLFVTNGSKLTQRKLTSLSLDEVTDYGMDILVANGEVWKQNRKLLVQGVIRNLKRSESIISKTVENTLQHIALETKSESGFVLGDLLKKHSSSVILEIAFGGIAILEHHKQQFLEAMDGINDYCDISHPRNVFPILKYFPRYQDRLRKMLKVRDNIMEEIFQQHLKDFKAGEPRDFVDIVLELFLEGSISNNQRRQILFDTFIGGTDTTATITEWMLAYLVNNPDVQKQIQSELDEVMQGKPVMYEDVSKLPLLQAAILETFRLRPVFPLVDRVTDKEYKVGNYLIPAKTNVWLNTYHLGMDPKLWKEPEQFRPQRFLQEEQGFMLRGAEPPKTKGEIRICPFGIGARACPGFQLGKMGVVMLVARLLQTYEWSTVDGKPLNMKEITGLITKPKTKLRFKAALRTI